MEEIDLWRSAHLLIKEHATLAEVLAQGQIERMQASGDAEGEAIWRGIMQAIKDLRRTAREVSQALQ